MDSFPMTFLLALIVNGFIAYRAVIRESVDVPGGIAGAVIGSAVLAGGGFWLWMILVFFFSTSSAFSSLGKEKKRRLEAMHRKGSRRDLWQVLANGSVGAAAALLYGWTGSPVFALACAAAFASATADTWASELGVLSTKQPISLRTGKRVPQGLSGGVSLRGSAAALTGSLLVGMLFFLQQLTAGSGLTAASGKLALLAAASGFISSFTDSLLGSTVQVHYLDDQAGGESEHPYRNGRSLRKVRGFPWITNDTVNFISILIGALLAVGGYFLWI